MSSLSSETTTTAALREKAKLRRHVGPAHLAFFMIAVLVSLDTIGAISSDGAQAFTVLAVMGLFFFIPYGLLCAELGSAFPQEGGVYVWTKLAWGRPVAAVIATLYWLDNPIWLGGTLTVTAITTYNVFFHTLSTGGEYVFGLIFIWAGVTAAIVSLRYGKWIPTVGSLLRVALISFFTLTVIIYAAEHGVHGFGAGSFTPTWTIFILAVPVVFFNYEGFELPSSAGEEMRHPARDIPLAVLRSAGTTLVIYIVPVLAILLVLPASQITGVAGFIDAMKQVFVVYGGHVTASGPVLTGAGRVLGDLAGLMFIFGVLSAGAAWIIGADRTQAVAGFDGAAPRALGTFSRRLGTPIRVNLLSGIAATTVMVLALILTDGSAAKYFSAALGLVISLTAIAYVVIFPAVIKLRYSHRNVPRPYRIPGGKPGVWAVGLVATVWAVLASIGVLYPGIGTADPDASLPSGFAGQRLQYELSQFIPLAAAVLLGLIFYALGRKTREERAAAPATAPVVTTDGLAVAEGLALQAIPEGGSHEDR